jgi:hypothetical protein
MSVTKTFFFAEDDEFIKSYFRCYIKRHIIDSVEDVNDRQRAFVSLVEKWPVKNDRDILEQVVLEFTG